MKGQRGIIAQQIALMLGDQMVDVELDPEHYDMAITVAIERLQQRSDGAMEEEDIFITIQPDVQEYTLPKEVQEVRRLYRSGIGPSNAGVDFDPMSAGLFQSTAIQTGRGGSLATWDFLHQYLETAERVFASQYNFTWHKSTNTLKILRRARAQEDVVVRVWTTKSEDALLLDPYTAPWIRSYALALCKHSLGQARGKFASGIGGPSGNVQYNGAEMMAQAEREIAALDKELNDIVTGGDGYGFIIG